VTQLSKLQQKHTRKSAFHHHHRQPWAQCPLVSDAILTIAAHRCLSRAAWLIGFCLPLIHNIGPTGYNGSFPPDISPAEIANIPETKFQWDNQLAVTSQKYAKDFVANQDHAHCEMIDEI